MTDRDLLLAAVLDNPGEDTPRLVLADKLDELGGAKNAARAELIRVQCELARVGAIDFGVAQPIGPPSPTGIQSLMVRSDRIPDRGLGGTIQYRTGNDCERHFAKVCSISGAYLGRPRPARVVVAVLPLKGWTGWVSEPGLRVREHAILKTYAAAFLPKSLRPGSPEVRVEGATVWCYPLRGYVAFDRGFVGRAGIELEPRPGDGGSVETAYSARVFAERVARLFRANPLTGFTVSFAGTDTTLHAEILEPGHPLNPERPKAWRLGWDGPTHDALMHDGAIVPPVYATSRGPLGRAVVPWLAAAIRGPAEAAAMEAAEAEDDAPVIHSEWLSEGDDPHYDEAANDYDPQ